MTHPLIDHIPWRLDANGVDLVKWLYVGDKRFTEPFFDETAAICRRMDRNRLRFSSASTAGWLTEAANNVDSVPPTAFIFHVSRCGSTLLSQLLALDDAHIALSEVPLLDECLRLYDKASLSAREGEEAFLASVRLLGKRRAGNERHLFIKLDSWHIFYFDTIRRLYPEVPFVMLYRSPAPIVRSHAKLRGMQMVPGMIDPSLLGFTEEEVMGIPFDHYTAKVLERFYAAFENAACRDHRTLLVNYEEGIMNIMEQIAKHAWIRFSNETLLAMQQRSSFHSKYPDREFAEKPVESGSPAWMQPALDAYARLENVRKY